MKPKGIPFGALWGLCIILIYIALFAGIGVYFVLGAHYSHFSWKLLLLGGAKTVAYCIGGAVIFVPVLLMSIYFVIRDRDLIYTFKRHWPLFLLGGFLLFVGIPSFPESVPEDAAVILTSIVWEMFRSYAARLKTRQKTLENL